MPRPFKFIVLALIALSTIHIPLQLSAAHRIWGEEGGPITTATGEDTLIMVIPADGQDGMAPLRVAFLLCLLWLSHSGFGRLLFLPPPTQVFFILILPIRLMDLSFLSLCRKYYVNNTPYAVRQQHPIIIT